MIEERGIPEQEYDESDASAAPVMEAEPSYEPEIQLEPEPRYAPVARRVVRGMGAVAPAIAAAGARISAAMPEEGGEEEEVDVAGENPEEVMGIDKDTSDFLFKGTDDEFMGTRDEDIDELTGEDEETDDFIFNPRIDEVAGNVEGLVGDEKDEERVLGTQEEEEEVDWTGFKREGGSIGGMQEVQQAEVGAPKSVWVPAHKRRARGTGPISQMGQMRGY